MIVPECTNGKEAPSLPAGLVPSKRERNRIERRANIVAIARTLFLRQGYAATTMSAVAEAMGGSKATLWAHFSSKEALFAEVADAMVGGFAQRSEELLGGQPFSVDGLRDFCHRFLDEMQRPESTTLFRMIIAEGGRFPEIGEMFFARGPAQMVDRLSRYFEGTFPRRKSEQLARLTINALVGLRTQGLILPRRVSRPEVTSFIDDLITTLPLE